MYRGYGRLRQKHGCRPTHKEAVILEAIIGFISASWVKWLFAVATAILAWCYRNISARLKIEQEKNEAIAAGVQSLLRESIVNNYNRYQDRGFCPIYAKDSIKKVYAAYHDLGGNDVATELYRKILAMPEQEVSDHDEQ